MLESFPLGSLFSDSGLSFTVGVSQFAGGGISVSFLWFRGVSFIIKYESFPLFRLFLSLLFRVK